MNKFYLTVCFCLSFMLFLSCDRPDLTDDVEWAYDYAYDYYNCPTEGAFRCRNNLLQRCYMAEWINFQQCNEVQDCNATTAKCDPKGDSSDSENSCTKIDGNMWSPRSSYDMNWDDAVAYCNNLTECGYSDWRLPTISELRTLIQNCSGTVTGGSCAVTDPTCLSVDECWDHSDCSCAKEDGTVNNDVYAGYYSKLGDDNVWLWSSSTATALDYSGSVWGINFADAYVGPTSSLNSGNVRCVRNAE